MSKPIPATNSERFSAEIAPHIPVLTRVACSICSNNTDAEDLVQDTLLRAFRSLSTFDGRYPRAWLMTIMRNAQLNSVRKKRPGLVRDPDGASDSMDMASDSGRTAEDVVVDLTFDTAVGAAFEALSESFAEVVTLVDIDRLSYQEAAAFLGVPPGTVMSRLHRARAAMREQLAESDARPGRAK